MKLLAQKLVEARLGWLEGVVHSIREEEWDTVISIKRTDMDEGRPGSLYYLNDFTKKRGEIKVGSRVRFKVEKDILNFDVTEVQVI